MATTFTIRRGVQTDLVQLVELTKNLATETEDGLVLKDEKLMLGISKGLDDNESGSSPMYFVAESSDEKGKILGFLAISPEWSDWWATWYWWVISVFVDSNFRRSGVGTKLFEEISLFKKRISFIIIYIYLS